MKKNTYIRDIEDTLGDDSSSKDVVKMTKKIKATQKKAFPSVEFKQHLSDRLSNIYALGQLDDMKPRFSLLQIFGTFANFIFIVGGIFSIYWMQEIPKNNSLQIQSSPKLESDMMQMQIMESEISELEMYDIPMSDDMSSRSSLNIIQKDYEQDMIEIC